MVLSKDVVSLAIEDSCGVRRLAAQRLGITERHLYRLLKKYELK